MGINSYIPIGSNAKAATTTKAAQIQPTLKMFLARQKTKAEEPNEGGLQGSQGSAGVEVGPVGPGPPRPLPGRGQGSLAVQQSRQYTCQGDGPRPRGLEQMEREHVKASEGGRFRRE